MNSATLAERPNAAETVTLFCGAGVQGAHAEVLALARADLRNLPRPSVAG